MEKDRKQSLRSRIGSLEAAVSSLEDAVKEFDESSTECGECTSKRYVNYRDFLLQRTLKSILRKLGTFVEGDIKELNSLHKTETERQVYDVESRG